MIQRVWIKLGSTKDHSFWTGGTDLGSEGKFYWTYSGEAFNYTCFDNNQPDNLAGKENCLHLWNGNKWNDNDCASKFRFICELNYFAKFAFDQ
jgi:hypothetical protein